MPTAGGTLRLPQFPARSSQPGTIFPGGPNRTTRSTSGNARQTRHSLSLGVLYVLHVGAAVVLDPFVRRLPGTAGRRPLDRRLAIAAGDAVDAAAAGLR